MPAPVLRLSLKQLFIARKYSDLYRLQVAKDIEPEQFNRIYAGIALKLIKTLPPDWLDWSIAGQVGFPRLQVQGHMERLGRSLKQFLRWLDEYATQDEVDDVYDFYGAISDDDVSDVDPHMIEETWAYCNSKDRKPEISDAVLNPNTLGKVYVDELNEWLKIEGEEQEVEKTLVKAGGGGEKKRARSVSDVDNKSADEEGDDADDEADDNSLDEAYNESDDSDLPLYALKFCSEEHRDRVKRRRVEQDKKTTWIHVGSPRVPREGLKGASNVAGRKDGK